MSKCLFCDIVQKQLPAKIKFENDDLMVFEDIKPAATHHYLSVPKEHIDSVHSLSTSDHKGLCKQADFGSNRQKTNQHCLNSGKTNCRGS